MRGKALLTLVACLSLPCLAQAAVVNITASVDKSTIALGETATFRVFAQVQGNPAGDGIFGWDVDLTVADVTGTNVLDLLPATFASTGWDNAGSTGTAVANGLDAIYDTSFLDDSKGIGSPIELFSIDVQGMSLGSASLTIGPDATQGADMATHLGTNDDSGNYSAGSVLITVVPEPTSMLLICAAAGPALLRRRRRS